MTWHETLKKAVKEFGLARVAADLEYSCTAISLVFNGTYTASTERIAARVLAIYGEIPCPFLHAQIPGGRCRDFRERSVPTNSAQEIRHWRACQNCKVGDDAFGSVARAAGQRRNDLDAATADGTWR